MDRPRMIVGKVKAMFHLEKCPRLIVVWIHASMYAICPSCVYVRVCMLMSVALRLSRSGF